MNLSKQPKVAVITLNYNQIDYTVGCVKSLLKSDYSNFEIILIDNGSSEENFKILKNRLPKDLRLNLPRLERNLGYVGGINFGLEKANETNCEYFLIMNNDTLIDENAIKELVFTSEKHNNNAIVSGKVYNYDEKDTLQYIGQDFDPANMLNQRSHVKNRREKDIGQYDQEMELGMTDDIMWMIPRKVYEEIGLYSDYFFLYGEQNDYALRAIKKGFKLIYTPKAKLWHKGGITTTDGNKKSPRIYYWTTFATFKLAVLHFPQNKAKKFCRNWILRNYIKHFILSMMGKSSFKILKAIYLANKNFKHWDKVRYIDNGYNPY